MGKEQNQDEQKKSVDRYALAEIVTQRDIAIMDVATEQILSDKDLLVEILNKLDRIEKSVA